LPIISSKELHMTDIDRRSALILSPAGAALIASPEPASAQASDAARNKEILAREYKRWHDTKGGSVASWMEIVDNNIQFGSFAEGMPAATFTAHVNGKQNADGAVVQLPVNLDAGEREMASN
jgi:hypothetical protein